MKCHLSLFCPKREFLDYVCDPQNETTIMAPLKKSTCHKYFVYDINNRVSVCQIINKETGSMCSIAIKNNHTTNLKNHLKFKHLEVYNIVKKNDKPLILPKKKETPVKTNDIKMMLTQQISIRMSKEILRDALIELCSVNGRPFSIVEDSGLVKILKPIIDGLGGDFAVNSHNVRDGVLEKAEQVRMMIKKEISNKLISLKLDLVTHLNRSFLGMNIQFVEKDKIQLRCLAAKELHDRHTGLNVKDAVLDVLSSYNVHLNQCYTVTTDNGTDMIKAVSLLDQEPNLEDQEEEEENIESDEDENGDEDGDEDENEDDISSDDEDRNWDEVIVDNAAELIADSSDVIGVRCAVHTHQLAIKPALKQSRYKTTITKARKIIKKLRTANITRLLRNQNLPRPVLDVPTRWNSTFHMLRSLVKPGIREFCDNLSVANRIFAISDAMWSKIQEIVTTLVPAEKATKMMQAEQLTLGDFYGIWMKCKFEIRAIDTVLARKLHSDMCAREKKLLSNVALKAAIYMDPRYQVTLSSEEKAEAVEILSSLYHRMQNLQNTTERMSIGETEEVAEERSLEDVADFELMLRGLERHREQESSENQTNGVDIKALLQGFANTKRLPSSANVLEYWNAEEINQPILCQLAKVVLGVPATQVSVERLFSGLKFTVSNLRAKLDGALVDSITLIRANSLFGLKV